LSSVHSPNLKPDILLADGAEAITIGSEKVFGNGLRIYCWFHVMRNVKDELHHLKDKKLHEQVLEDIPPRISKLVQLF